MAGSMLLLGVLVYLTDRPVASGALVPHVAALAGHPVFGAVGQWLPSFVHPFAFSLLTAAALPARGAFRYGACVAWGVVNLAFELGQHAALQRALAQALTDAFGSSAPVRGLADYFLRGTFDPGDAIAILLGALAAAAVLGRAGPREERSHAR